MKLKWNIQQTCKAKGINSSYELQKAMQSVSKKTIYPGLAIKLWREQGSSLSLENIGILLKALQIDDINKIIVIPKSRVKKSKQGEESAA